MDNRAPRVALLVETACGYGRGLLQGIVRYARLYGPWSFYLAPGGLAQALPRMDKWQGTGIIARIETPELAEAILATKVPVIALDLTREQLLPGNPLSTVCEVCPNSEKAAAMAAEHLIERSVRQFAFVGSPHDPFWSTRREAGFRDRLVAEGLTCHIYPVPSKREWLEWAHEQAVMSDWLRSLPLPVGLLACDDERGRQVLEACRVAGLRVPDDVAVVGVDNDELLCDLSDPTLSSVVLDTPRAGFEAAELLDGLMAGRMTGTHRIHVEPLYVLSRRSTDTTAVGDPYVASAIRFIRDFSNRPITVTDVVAHVGTSRRNLELRFEKALGWAIHEELQRTRLGRVKRLLVETELDVHDVAAAVGFSSSSYLNRIFHRRFGMSPTAFRRESAARTPRRKRERP
jgi:LacI family transcriptional regulator